MSRKYTIPLTWLYPAATPTGRIPSSVIAEDDSDEDIEFSTSNPVDTDTDNNNNQSSDSESEDEEIPPTPPPPPPVNERLRRNRQPPAWIRGGEYEMNSDDHNE